LVGPLVIGLGPMVNIIVIYHYANITILFYIAMQIYKYFIKAEDHRLGLGSD
jgi:hypothetical protein